MTGISDTLKLEGLRSDDIVVRSIMLRVMAESGSTGTVEHSAAVLDGIEREGWEKAFHGYRGITELPLDEQICERIFQMLTEESFKLPEETPEALRIRSLVNWICKSDPDLVEKYISGIAEIPEIVGQQGSDTPIDSLLKAFERVHLQSVDADECRELLDSQKADLIEDFADDESVAFPIVSFNRIEAIVERLGQLKGIAESEVMQLVNREVDFADEEEGEGPIEVWLGLIMAQAAGIPIPVERCIELLDCEWDFIEDDTRDSIIQFGTAETLNQLADIFLGNSVGIMAGSAGVFDKLRFSGFESRLLQLASDIEDDYIMRGFLVLAASYYGTEEGLNGCYELYRADPEDGELFEVTGVLYSIWSLQGKTVPEMEKWKRAWMERGESESDERLAFADWMVGGDPDFSQFMEDLHFYSPDDDIPADQWLDEDEQHRQALISNYVKHHEAHIEGARLHAAVHLVVENQIADSEQDWPTRATLERLMEQGTTRHEAIHAIGSVVAEELFQIAKEKRNPTPVEEISRKLNQLVADDWVGSAPITPLEKGLPIRNVLTSPNGGGYKREDKKVGRNDPCPCGSGKKYKKCCL